MVYSVTNVTNSTISRKYVYRPIQLVRNPTRGIDYNGDEQVDFMKKYVKEAIVISV